MCVWAHGSKCMAHILTFAELNVRSGCARKIKLRPIWCFGIIHFNFHIYNEIMMNFPCEYPNDPDSSSISIKRDTQKMKENESERERAAELHTWNMNINYLSIPIWWAFLYPLSNSTCSIYLLEWERQAYSNTSSNSSSRILSLESCEIQNIKIKMKIQ